MWKRPSTLNRSQRQNTQTQDPPTKKTTTVAIQLMVCCATQNGATTRKLMWETNVRPDS